LRNPYRSILIPKYYSMKKILINPTCPEDTTTHENKEVITTLYSLTK